MNLLVTSDRQSLVLAGMLLAIATAAGASRLQDALDLERKGKLKESSEVLQGVAAELRASGDWAGLARALSVSARISVSLGDYRTAIQSANEAVSARGRIGDRAGVGEDYNTLGLANLYLGDYSAALPEFEKALDIDHRQGDGDGIVARLNNIGNIYYFRGQYQDALRAYQQAMDTLQGAGAQTWNPQRRQLTIANLATLYQRLGKEQEALQYYRQLTESPQALPRSEYAQLLLNEGVLYRRMGDPVKALERYRLAQTIFATGQNRDSEIGAFRNIGIVLALDFGDLEGARASFTQAMNLARQSSDTRGIVQAALYRAEVVRRLGRRGESGEDLQIALEGAQKSGLVEEEWKSQYGLGRLAESAGDSPSARGWYRQALAGIETVRAGMRRTTLRSEFLGDKRDVYDAAIGLELRQTNPPLGAIFTLMEHSRARALEDRLQPFGQETSIQRVQDTLHAGTVFVEFWVGNGGIAALWITNSNAGVVRPLLHGPLAEKIADFEKSLQSGDERWKGLSIDLGSRLLVGIPAAKHLIVAPDGPLNMLPFEALTAPESGRLVIEDRDVSYIPAARFLTRETGGPRGNQPPWRTQLVAYGDPPLSGTDMLGRAEHWQPLHASADEIHSIAGMLPGQSEVYLGAAAQKHRLLGQRFAGGSILHFSTHAVVDSENPDRSRILMASDSGGTTPGYLFQQEIYDLHLKGVDLVTLSACETARGPIVRGDGVRAFSQAFLAAGTAATVTSLWQVEDRATAEFMKQFYYFLARGQTKSEALRSAKLRLLYSNSRLAGPSYWSTFILNGDGWNPCAAFFPWSWLVGAAGAVILSAGIWLALRLRRSVEPSFTAASPRHKTV